MSAQQLTCYGITLNFEVITVRIGSLKMMSCRDLCQSFDEAVKRAAELKALHEAKP